MLRRWTGAVLCGSAFVRRIVTLAAAIALAAVVASAPDPAKTVGTTTTLDVTKSKLGTPPPDFDFLQTGEGEPGRWTVVRDVTAIDGTAIEHVSTDQHENRYSLAIYAPVSTKDFKLSVRFKIMKGTMQAAGIAVRFLDVDSYYLVSASALEERLDLFRVVNGKKERIWGTDADVVRDRWHLLELQANDDQFVISLDRNWLFTARDNALPNDGRVGLWTEEDNVTHFDRFEIDAFPASEKRCCRIE
jgi:hypothetical protein